MSLKIYHNPRCSKSRQTLALLEENGHAPEIVLYLTDTLTVADLKTLLSQLGMASAREIMRTGEGVYKELGLKTEDDEAVLLRALVENPKLIERPIVVNGGKAAIGRPPESVLALF
ncbi:MAG: arsenate reductase (glutaredoxin) [Robiginitomaculum sp.]|nr:MAG: arsenate reductase (glutaredoxin) [Robiginitomaculum sp.]